MIFTHAHWDNCRWKYRIYSYPMDEGDSLQPITRDSGWISRFLGAFWDNDWPLQDLGPDIYYPRAIFDEK